ncbi:MAG: PepSY domain-containing protein [Cyclobacteriaceae bacterium]|nr:PepSY domain-containing protein [Cyclobacteriaceae bacterium]
MPLKKIIGKIHLWLGLSSGLLVFVIAITGCIYAFQEEIQNATQSYRFIQQQEKPFLPPSEIQLIALQQLPDKHLHAIMYQDSVHAAKAIFYSYEDQYYFFVYINPYSGEVMKIKDVNADFFRFILDGHFYLWLPPEIGQPIAASATLIFFFMLISGIVLWWPKKNTHLRQKLSIKRVSGWKRKNYDLHSVLGFYISWLALILVYTGLIWGFEWFRNSAYYVATGGEDYVEYHDPGSKEIKDQSASIPAIDRVWAIMNAEYPQADWIEIHPPEDSLSSIAANANPDGSTYWKTDYRYFDQYTLEELSVPHIYNRLHESGMAQKLFRMNYDIHVGGILGLPGKIIAFLLSLTIASLPVTGFVFWLGKRKKHKTHLSYPLSSTL